MNTSRPSSFAPVPSNRPVHRSARTCISENLDPATGQRTQLLSTSELTLAWVGDDLQVKYRASHRAFNPDRIRAERLARRGFGG